MGYKGVIKSDENGCADDVRDKYYPCLSLDVQSLECRVLELER